MRFFESSTRWIGFACTIALLAACNGGSQQPMSPATGAQAMRLPAHLPADWPSQWRGASPVSVPQAFRAGTPDRGPSWIRKNITRRPALLYITNWLHGTVTIYRYRNGQDIDLFGKLIGFHRPGQPCVNGKGDVYVPENDGTTVTGYHWGDVHPFVTLSDPYGQPISCSIDPTTGNLAAANYGYGSVTIWPGATGSPVEITNGINYLSEFVAYDDSGDLLLGSSTPDLMHGLLSYLPAGASSFTDLTLSGFTLGQGGNVQWGGTYWLVGDQGTYGVGCPCHVVQVSVSGSTASLDGSVLTFGGSPVDIVGFWKRGAPRYAHISAADFGADDDFIYSFPAMAVVNTVTSRVRIPFGVAVSQQGP